MTMEAMMLAVSAMAAIGAVCDVVAVATFCVISHRRRYCDSVNLSLYAGRGNLRVISPYKDNGKNDGGGGKI